LRTKEAKPLVKIHSLGVAEEACKVSEGALLHDVREPRKGASLAVLPEVSANRGVLAL